MTVVSRLGAPRWAWTAMAVGLLAVGLLVPAALLHGRVAATTTAVGPSPASSPAPVGSSGQSRPVLSDGRADGVLDVLFAGDGITAGSGASNPEATSFRALLTERLGADGPVRVQRIGGPGAGTGRVLPQIAPAGPVDLVIVGLGTNDAYDGPVQEFRADYPTFLSAVRATSPHAVLVCLGVWPSAPGASPFDGVIRSSCEERRGRYVSLDGIYDDVAMRSADPSHPNDAGHAAIAAAVLTTLGG